MKSENGTVFHTCNRLFFQRVRLPKTNSRAPVAAPSASRPGEDSALSNKRTFVTINQLVETQTSPLLGLLAKRLHTTNRFVLRYTFDAPHRKEHRAQTDERLLVNYGPNPLIKRVQVETAQEYSSRVDFVEYAPTLLTRRVQYDQNWCAPFNHC